MHLCYQASPEDLRARISFLAYHSCLSQYPAGCSALGEPQTQEVKGTLEGVPHVSGEEGHREFSVSVRLLE